MIVRTLQVLRDKYFCIYSTQGVPPTPCVLWYASWFNANTPFCFHNIHHYRPCCNKYSSLQDTFKQIIFIKHFHSIHQSLYQVCTPVQLYNQSTMWQQHSADSHADTG